MIHFKSCPRCKGDMQDTSDIYGKFKECLQCGNVIDIETPPVLKLRPRRTRLAEWEVA